MPDGKVHINKLKYKLGTNQQEIRTHPDTLHKLQRQPHTSGAQENNRQHTSPGVEVSRVRSARGCITQLNNFVYIATQQCQTK